MTHLQVLAIVLAIMAVLALFVWLVDRLLDGRASQPARVRPERADPSVSIHDADDYFHGTGAFRLRLHELRRQRAAEKDAASTIERQAA